MKMGKTYQHQPFRENFESGQALVTFFAFVKRVKTIYITCFLEKFFCTAKIAQKFQIYGKISKDFLKKLYYKEVFQEMGCKNFTISVRFMK